LSHDFTSAASLLEQSLLSQAEFMKFRSDRRFPSGFPERVLDRFERAVPINRADNVISQNIFWVDAFSGPAPPIPAYDGPLPPEFVPRNIPGHAVVLHDARRAKMFVGYNSSTLLIDDRHYYEGISSPNSEWITPAFAGANPDITLDGTAAVLFANGASLYSHWMFDLLPKFEILRRACWTDDRIDYYVVNSWSAQFCVESLARLGVDHKKIVDGTGQLISAERLLVPSPVRWKFWTPDWVRDFIVSTFLGSGDCADDVGRDKRIYISRANARRRRVTNDEEIRDILESRNFSTVLAERIGISQFAALVRCADRILAPHGAGVTNVVFARPGVRVLELFGAHIASEGWLMTNAVNGQHFLLAGKDNAGRYPWEPGAYHELSLAERNAADYFIDTDQLSRALDRMETQGLTASNARC
jgi:hypothetical protein